MEISIWEDFIFEILHLENFNLQIKFPNFKFANFKVSHFKILEKRKTGTHTFQHFQICRSPYMKNNIVKGGPRTFSCIFVAFW